jgi:hypothetical protein
VAAEGRRRRFGSEFDVRVELDPPGCRASFGLNMMGDLVAGIDEFVALRQERWGAFRAVGPVLLGCAMWFDDAELVTALGRLAGAGVVIKKQGRRQRDRLKLAQLAALNERTPGLLFGAFPELGGLAPTVDGEPRQIGPYDNLDEFVLPSVRTLGFRSSSPFDNPPIIHAKLALLGQLCWHDEDALGYPADVFFFRAKRLWLSSANFTTSSRRSLDFGLWLEEPAVLEGARRYLLGLLAHSEPLDADPDDYQPELAPVTFDDAEMAAAVPPYDPDEEEDDDEEGGLDPQALADWFAEFGDDRPDEDRRRG